MMEIIIIMTLMDSFVFKIFVLQQGDDLNREKYKPSCTKDSSAERGQTELLKLLWVVLCQREVT